jgi:hypothetical protein
VNLSTFGLTELPDLGHYCTWANTETQTGPTLTDSQQGILGNNSTNITEMIYI